MRIFSIPASARYTVALMGVFAAGCNGDSSSPPAPVATVVVEPASTSRLVGEAVQYVATASAANGSPVTGRPVTWESSNINVATISPTGLATTVGTGTTTITATIDGVANNATLTVTPAVASIAISPKLDTIGRGKAVQLSAVMLDASGGNVTGRDPVWTVEPQGTASVSPTGLVTGIEVGTATVTATIDGRSDVATIEILDECSALLSVPLAIGQSVQGALQPSDCQLSDGTFIDAYLVEVSSPTDVQIDLVSTVFDPYLILGQFVNGEFVEIAFNDDIDFDGGNFNSRILFTLQPGIEYHVLANSFDDNTFGAYTLAVTEVSNIAAMRWAEGDEAPRVKRGRIKAPVHTLWPRR